MALREKHPDKSLVLWGRNAARVHEIRTSGLQDVTDNLAEAVAEADLVILAVPIEWIGGDLMYVIQLELALRSALGAATTLFYAYFRAKRLRWVLALWAQ